MRIVDVNQFDFEEFEVGEPFPSGIAYYHYIRRRGTNPTDIEVQLELDNTELFQGRWYISSSVDGNVCNGPYEGHEVILGGPRFGSQFQVNADQEEIFDDGEISEREFRWLQSSQFYMDGVQPSVFLHLNNGFLRIRIPDENDDPNDDIFTEVLPQNLEGDLCVRLRSVRGIYALFFRVRYSEEFVIPTAQIISALDN
ncbi:MAG: hypothetical protein AAGF33_14015 [Pseudomonadota bacterium]